MTPSTAGDSNEQRCMATLHFFRRHVFEVMPQQPLVAERVAYQTRTLAVELIGQFGHDRRAGVYRLAHQGVGIVNVQMNREGGPAEGLRTAESA